MFGKPNSCDAKACVLPLLYTPTIFVRRIEVTHDCGRVSERR